MEQLQSSFIRLGSLDDCGNRLITFDEVELDIFHLRSLLFLKTQIIHRYNPSKIPYLKNVRKEKMPEA